MRPKPYHFTLAAIGVCMAALLASRRAAAQAPLELDEVLTSQAIDYTADHGTAMASDRDSANQAVLAGFNQPAGASPQALSHQYWGAAPGQWGQAPSQRRAPPNPFGNLPGPWETMPGQFGQYPAAGQRPYSPAAAMPMRGQMPTQPIRRGASPLGLGATNAAPMNRPSSQRAAMTMETMPSAADVKLSKRVGGEAVQSDAPAESAVSERPSNGAGSEFTASDSNCQCASGGDCSCDACDCCSPHCLPLFAIEECCPLGCEDKEIWRAFGDCCCLKERGLAVFGWVDGGIMGNGRLSPDRFNGPVTFPDRRGEGQLNQFYCVLERAIPEDNCGLFIGGRVDYLLGTDYIYNTAAGFDGTSEGNIPRWDINRFYGSDIPQMYVETAYNDLKVKWGHFYTIIGYEVVPAIGNFFYTHSYTQQYGEPFTHTGILASQPLGEKWTAYAGITNGWDTFNTDARANFLGGLTYTQDDWGSLAFAIHTGGESIFGPGVGPWANRTIYSIVWSRTLTSRLTYLLQSDYGNQDLNPIGQQNAEWYGVNQYVFYKLNCCWTAGARIEWFRDDDGYRVTGLRQGNAIAGASFPGDFYECTLGLNWKPNANLIVRPEVRWDWYNGEPNQNQAVAVTSPYDAGTRNNQFLYGVDVIYQW